MMVSACELKFDSIFVTGQKASVPDELLYLFQESDRRELTNSDGEIDIGYFANRDAILHRLEIAGYSSQIVSERFDAWLKTEMEGWKEISEDNPEWATPIVTALEQFNYDEWKRRAKEVLITRYDDDYPKDAYIDVLDKEMRRSNEEWLFFDSDILVSIRALIEAFIDINEVCLDISPLIGGGWLEPDQKICKLARAPNALRRPILESAIIITEGSTDILVLKRSLQKLFPYLNDYITFFDYENSKPDAGVSYLVKFIRAFAAARIGTKIIAIFDNDAAGLEGLQSISRIILPENIKAIKLPDIEIAKSYPTLGPQGAHEIDVNGKAVSIEFFLGRHNLLDSNNMLMPVVWKSYLPKADCYQGELKDKKLIMDRFLKDSGTEKDFSVYQLQYPELVILWERIFSLLRDEYTPCFRENNS